MLDMTLFILLNLGFSIDMIFGGDLSFCYFTFGLFVCFWLDNFLWKMWWPLKGPLGVVLNRTVC